MAEPAKDTDQSMEDILQSIKRIIADEGDAPPPSAAGSDVLELTELLAEDAAPPAVEEDEASAAPSISLDDLMAAPASSPVAVPEPKQPEPVAAPVSAPVAPSSESLMSESTLSEALNALTALSQAPAAATAPLMSPVFRSGVTVEDLVVEALKPMLKEWLDGNLPSMVKSLVEKEIRRLSGH